MKTLFYTVLVAGVLLIGGYTLIGISESSVSEGKGAFAGVMLFFFLVPFLGAMFLVWLAMKIFSAGSKSREQKKLERVLRGDFT